MKKKSQPFLVAKYHVFLHLLSAGWIPHDLFFAGGPDFVAMLGARFLRLKIRYSVRGNSGFVFSVGSKQTKSFFELVGGCDFLIFVCLDKGSPVGFYIFPKEHAPKTKTFLHPITGPFPKYRVFYDSWRQLTVPVEKRGWAEGA